MAGSFSISSTIGPVYPHSSHLYCSGKSHMSNLLDKRMWGFPHLGQYFFVGLLRFRLPSISRKFRSLLTPMPLSVSLELYILPRKTQLYEKRLNLFPVVSLEYYLVVLRGTAARAKGFKLLCETPKVLILVVDALHYRGWFSEFACFATYFNALLVFADFGAHAYVFGKPARRANLCHVSQLARECGNI